MINLKELISAISQISEERGIPKEKIIETIEQALASAYKKDFGKKGQLIKCQLDPATGELRFWQVKLVVDKKMIYSEDELGELEKLKLKPELVEARETVEGPADKKVRFNPERHLMITEAKKNKKKVKAGEELEFPLETKADFGRIAAQTAKQVVLQKIKEIEKEMVFSEFIQKEGEVVSGIVQRLDGRNVFLNIGRALGILIKEEQVPGEFYRPGQRLKVYLLKTESSPRGPMIFLSRAHPKLISKLFELEVPEIAAKQVEIKSIAREPGARSKVAVASNDERIDPIGATVGQRGSRVMAVINELGGEKIDIIQWSDSPEQLIANSLSPAKVAEVKIGEKNTAAALVPDDQLSLAIGRDGQNVRLAAKLTGWKIDVRSQNQTAKAEAEAEVKPEIKESKPAPKPKTAKKKTKTKKPSPKKS
jgi:N utilization substance protein A